MASSDTLELDELLFYQHLTSTHSDLYTRAQEVCSIIIIPQNISNSLLSSRDVFESHLFRPSPCYIRKHVSWNDKYEIELDVNRTIKISNKKEGAGEKRIKVLSQEDVRDSIRQRSYSILVVEQPIIDTSGMKNLPTNVGTRLLDRSSFPAMPKFSITTASYESSFMFLDSLRQIEPAFARLRTQLFLFNETYVILPKFVGNAVEKLRDCRKEFLKEAYQLLNKSDDRDIDIASEIYITGNTYTKVWPIILQHMEDKDQTLYENILKRQRKQRLTKSMENNLNKNLSALNELKRLDDLKSAYEKARCIRSTLDLAIAAKTLMVVDPVNSAVRYHSSSEDMPMAADETLTAFIDLICQLISQSDENDFIHLCAHEYYTEIFRFEPLPQDIDYAFTTYRGVLEYLSNSASWF